MSLRELARLEGFAVGAVKDVLVTVFDRTATMERLTLLEKTQAQFIATHPRMVAFNVVTGDSLQQPPAEVRALSSQLQQRFDGSTLVSATVLDVKGLGAAIARGFLAALALVSGGSKPTQVFRTSADALTWLRGLPEWANHGDAALTAQAIDDFVASVRKPAR